MFSSAKQTNSDTVKNTNLGSVLNSVPETGSIVKRAEELS